MSVFDKILWHLAVILPTVLGDRVFTVFLLEEHVPGVGDVCQDDLHIGVHPRLSLPGINASVHQGPANLNPGCAFHVLGIHPADDICFLRYDDQFVVLPLIPENAELAVGNALLEPLDRAPFDVFGNAAAFFLCEGSKDGKHQLSVAAQGIDVFLLEAHLNAEVLQVPDRVQKVHGVPRKSLDRLGEDYVDVSGFTLSQHVVELITLFGAGAGDPVIRKNASVFPFWVLLNQCAVVAHLCRKRVLHPLGFHRHSGVGSDSLSCFQNRQFSLDFLYCFQ